jgi:Raf kinase inhibitor-like YbhB/YbcL family protein
MLKYLAGAALAALVATPSFALELTSRDLKEGQSFDAKFVCAKYNGQNVSPELSWSGLPAGTKSLAITMFDPDAGKSGFWHWLAADIPASIKGFAEGAGGAGELPPGSTALANGAGHANYDGPCPPAGAAHHYQITVYAMPDEKSAIPAGAKAPEIGAWLAEHALATARLTPVFAKP